MKKPEFFYKLAFEFLVNHLLSSLFILTAPSTNKKKLFVYVFRLFFVLRLRYKIYEFRSVCGFSDQLKDLAAIQWEQNFDNIASRKYGNRERNTAILHVL